MATNYKVLGQVNPLATTETDLYIVPPGKQAVSSSIVVCNQDSSDATFRISVSVLGAATTAKDYLAYGTVAPGNDLDALTLGITLSETDAIRVYASTATLSFSAFGSEIDNP